MMGLILGRPDRLMAGIRQYTANKQDYIGCMTQGTIVRNATRKWFEPQHVRYSLLLAPRSAWAKSVSAIAWRHSRLPLSLRMSLHPAGAPWRRQLLHPCVGAFVYPVRPSYRPGRQSANA